MLTLKEINGQFFPTSFSVSSDFAKQHLIYFPLGWVSQKGEIGIVATPCSLVSHSVYSILGLVSILISEIKAPWKQIECWKAKFSYSTNDEI